MTAGAGCSPTDVERDLNRQLVDAQAQLATVRDKYVFGEYAAARREGRKLAQKVTVLVDTLGDLPHEDA